MIALGFLLLVIVYLILSVLLTWAVARRIGNKQVRTKVIVTMTLVFLLIPTWDEILGRYYFERLCASEGGVKVFRTVELGPKYWNEDGTPKFLKNNGDLDESILGGKYSFSYGRYQRASQLFRITKAQYKVVDNSSGETIATYTLVGYLHGWFLGLMPGPISVGCPSGESIFEQLIGKAFRLAASPKEGM